MKSKNAAGRFPLLLAAEYGRPEAAKVLIENGADVNDTDPHGKFSLLAAACKGHAGVVAVLAEKGANMKMALPDGQTPLMCAARAGHVEAVKVLLEKGSYVNAKTANGDTALADAANAGHVAVSTVLLEQGADPGAGAVPDSLMNLNGKVVSVIAKKNMLHNVLGRIAETASQDGYTITIDSKKEQSAAFKARGPWNKVLNELAKRDHLLLVVKDKEVFVIPYDPAAVKHEAM